MARPLRYIPPGSMVEITVRTIQARFLLRPSAELSALILGVLGRALSMYAVELHAFRGDVEPAGNVPGNVPVG